MQCGDNIHYTAESDIVIQGSYNGLLSFNHIFLILEWSVNRFLSACPSASL